MQMLNRRGPRIEPCWTPISKSIRLLEELLILVLRFLSVW